jgi:hypothetical protein
MLTSLLLGIVGIATAIGNDESNDKNERVPFVNVANDGDYMHCNTDPNYFISDLSLSDRLKVSQMEFVQAMFRHGTRLLTSGYPYDFFPEYAEKNPDWKIECNVTQIDGREHVGTPNNIRFRKNYVKNEQSYKGSTCNGPQSLEGTVHQMQATSDIFKERYFGNKYQYKIFNKNELKSSNLEIYSTDTTRTIDSAMYFTEHLLEKQEPATTIDLTIHDLDNEPFRMDSNKYCQESIQWKQWHQKFEDAVNNKQERERFENSEYAKDLIARYESFGGQWLGGSVFELSTPFRLGYHYCAGLDIPIPLDLWQDMAKYDDLWQEAYDRTEYGRELNRCYYHTESIPAYQVTLNAINKMKNKQGPKALIISSHAHSMRPYLWGLNIEDDHKWEKLAGLVTLEIYSAAKPNDDDIEYLFRWTRNGKFLPYKLCNDYYKKENSQLCDLQIMLDADFKDIVPINEFNQNVCSKAIDLCLCGLCDDQ